MANISLAGWSLNRRFRKETDPLRLEEYPRVVKEEFGIDAVELNSPFFASKEEDYLQSLVAAASEVGVSYVGMAVDGTGNPSSLDEDERQASLAQIKSWFPVAKTLGLPAFRVNTGGRGQINDADALNQCVRSFKELAKVAEEYGVKLLIENHWGISTNPKNIVRIIEEVASDHLGTLPDFGNFPSEKRPQELEAIRSELPEGVGVDEIRYWGLELLAPYALAVHAKMYSFDEEGNETTIDIARCVAIMKNAGYDGYWGIEYEGAGDDHEGVLKSKALLERCLA